MDVARIVLVPAVKVAASVRSAHVVHTPVVGKATVTGGPPLTETASGRSAAVPLAYRKVSVAGPAVASGTVHST